jgi:predicted Zn-dependent peptidase
MRNHNQTSRFSRLSRLLGASLGLAVFVAASACDKGDSTTPPDDAVADAEPEAEKEPERVYPDPPPPSEPRPVNFPELQKFVFDKNGLTVYVVENHEVPLVDARLMVKAGEVDDELLATMTASMLAQGTKKNTKAQFDAKIEQVGSSINSFADTHNSIVSTRVLSQHLPLALGLMGEMVTAPRFEAEALDKVKDQEKTGLRQQKSSPDSLAQRLMGMVMYPEGHPYGRDFPSDDEVDAVTIDQIKEFHDTYYKANNAFLLLSGDITVDQAKKVVKQKLSRWKPVEEGALPASPLKKFGPKDFQAALPTEMTVHIVDRKSMSASIYIGNLSMTRSDPGWLKLAVVNRILGSGPASRLFKDIREQRKLTYNVNSFSVPAQSVGAFFIGTQSKEVDQMLNALFEHRDRMRDEDPSQQEYDDAIRSLVQAFPLQLETPQQIASKVSTVLTYHLPEDYWQTYRDEVQKVQLSDVKAASQKYIHDFPVIVIVGRAKKIEKQLANVERLKDAKIVVYDTELKVKK